MSQVSFQQVLWQALSSSAQLHASIQPLNSLFFALQVSTLLFTQACACSILQYAQSRDMRLPPAHLLASVVLSDESLSSQPFAPRSKDPTSNARIPNRLVSILGTVLSRARQHWARWSLASQTARSFRMAP